MTDSDISNLEWTVVERAVARRKLEVRFGKAFSKAAAEALLDAELAEDAAVDALIEAREQKEKANGNSLTTV